MLTLRPSSAPLDRSVPREAGGVGGDGKRGVIQNQSSSCFHLEPSVWPYISTGDGGERAQRSWLVRVCARVCVRVCVRQLLEAGHCLQAPSVIGCLAKQSHILLIMTSAESA